MILAGTLNIWPGSKAITNHRVQSSRQWFPLTLESDTATELRGEQLPPGQRPERYRQVPGRDGRLPLLQPSLPESRRALFGKGTVEPRFGQTFAPSQGTGHRMGARRLGRQKLVIFGAPSYFRRHGIPTSNENLVDHDLVAGWRRGKRHRWLLKEDKGNDTLFDVSVRHACGNNCRLWSISVTYLIDQQRTSARNADHGPGSLVWWRNADPRYLDKITTYSAKTSRYNRRTCAFGRTSS